ncbi:MAG TPA: thioredoxin domain-containing protein [Chthoniobacterales bacterium]|jgi:protein-disulfide isomerase
MKRYLPFIIVITVGLLTVAGGTILYRVQRAAAPIISEDDVAKVEAEAKVTHVRGAAKAKVTLEEFGDFQCPPCGMLAGPLREMEQENKDNLRVIFRNFPLETHAHAFEAACAAEAADLQGKFWEMHDLIYREQPRWGAATDARELFVAYAGTLGLDVARFTKDIDKPEVKERVEQDQKRGKSLGVTNTPTLFLNNQLVPPNSLNPQILHKIIRETVEKSENPSE